MPFGTFDDTEEWLLITRYLGKGTEMLPDKTVFRVADRHENLAVGIRLPNVSDDEMKLNIILRPEVSFDPVEFCKWTAERSPVFMVPRLEITDKTWDRSTDLRWE